MTSSALPRSRVARVVEIARRQGVASLWFRALSLVGYRRFDCVRATLADVPRMRTGTRDVRTGRLARGDVDAYLAFRRGAKRSDFLARLDHGSICHGVWCRGRLAAVAWTELRVARIWGLHAEFDVPPDQAYLFDSYTHRDFRRRGLRRHLLGDLVQMAGDRGITHLMGMIVPENRPMYRWASRIGFRRTGRVRRLALGPRVWFIRSGDAPELRPWSG